MKALKTKFATSKIAEEEGVWVTVMDAVKFKIRRMNSKRAIEIRAGIEQPYLKLKNKINGEYPNDIAEKLGARYLAEASLVDWEGVTDDDGNEIPYSPDAAYNLLNEIKELATLVFTESTSIDNFKTESQKEIVGN
jgi:hypothetical protein